MMSDKFGWFWALIQGIIQTFKKKPMPIQPAPKVTINPLVPKDPIIPKADMISKWANAIVKWEGHFDGNLKYTTLTKSWGATIGRPALDGGNFCQWKDEASGFNALYNFLSLGAEGQLIISHPRPCTLDQFTTRFAGNPPLGYKQGIAKMLGVSLDVDISTFTNSV